MCKNMEKAEDVLISGLFENYIWPQGRPSTTPLIGASYVTSAEYVPGGMEADLPVLRAILNIFPRQPPFFFFTSAGR